MDRKTADELKAHMYGTYYSLRIGLVAIGVALPLVLVFTGGTLHDVWFEGSISAYYHTEPQVRFFTTRDLFVGGLLAAGACLYLYKGFSDAENIALNMAGVFAVFVVLLPTVAPGTERGVVSILHAAAAILFFLCIAYVSLFRSRETLTLLPEEQRAWFARVYDMTGASMIVSPLAALVLSYTLKPDTLIFWIETLGIWAFAAYWFVKTMEMRRSQAEQRALEGGLQREVIPDTDGAPEVRSSPREPLPRRTTVGSRSNAYIVPTESPDEAW